MIILFFENNNINKIKELHYKLNDAMNGISLSDFNPNNINYINSSSIIDISSYYNEPESEKKNTIKEYSNMVDDLNKKNEEKENNNNLCPICNKFKIIGFCEHCNMLFCQDCYSMITEKEKNIHKLIYIDTLKTEKGKKIQLFLNSLNNTIKYLLSSCSYILNNQTIQLIPLDNSFNNYNNKSKIEYIKRIFIR